MTQNRRYTDRVGRDLERSQRDRALRGEPHSLTVDEVRATGRRREVEAPIPVTAIVRHRVLFDEPREIGAEVGAVAIAYTDGAALIRWKDAVTGHDHFSWVYAGAVHRR